MAYKQLSDKTRCEAHHGHCHITRLTSHYLQSLNEATKFAPPHCLNFDHGTTLKSGRRSASASSVPDVHVTIQNIAPDGSSYQSSAGPFAVSSSSVIPQNHVAAPSKDITYDKSSFPGPSSAGLSVASSSSAISQHLIATPPSHPSLPNLADSDALSHQWGTPNTPTFHGQSSIFPPLSSVMALLTSNHPGKFWNQLEEFLWEAGVNSSEHILLADPTVLALIGNMGKQQATVLRNCARRVILPALGSTEPIWSLRMRRKMKIPQALHLPANDPLIMKNLVSMVSTKNQKSMMLNLNGHPHLTKLTLTYTGLVKWRTRKVSIPTMRKMSSIRSVRMMLRDVDQVTTILLYLPLSTNLATLLQELNACFIYKSNIISFFCIREKVKS